MHRVKIKVYILNQRCMILSRKASIGMYSGCDDKLSLQILFVYCLTLPSLLHPSILFNCFLYLCIYAISKASYIPHILHIHVINIEEGEVGIRIAAVKVRMNAIPSSIQIRSYCGIHTIGPVHNVTHGDCITLATQESTQTPSLCPLANPGYKDMHSFA